MLFVQRWESEFMKNGQQQLKLEKHQAFNAHSHSTADELPGGGAVPRRRVRPDAVRSVSRGAVPRPAVEQADQSQTRCTPSCLTPIQTGGSQPHGRRPDVPNVSASCMIQARGPARTISALSRICLSIWLFSFLLCDTGSTGGESAFGATSAHNKLPTRPSP